MSAILKKSVDHGKSWKMFCSHVERVVSFDVNGLQHGKPPNPPFILKFKEVLTHRGIVFFLFHSSQPRNKYVYVFSVCMRVSLHACFL